MQTPDEFINDMVRKAKARDALPCRIVIHEAGKPEGRPFNATWVLDAPYAHSLWSQHAVMLFDLTTPFGDTAPHIYKPGVTHEVICYAVDPNHPIGGENDLAKMHLLTPPNFGYQITAKDDAEAEARIGRLVKMFIDREISPDTDWRRVHDRFFSEPGDVSLRQDVADER